MTLGPLHGLSLLDAWDRSEDRGGPDTSRSDKARAQVQRAAALRERLRVLLCQPLVSRPTPAAVAEDGSGPAGPRTNHRQSAKELRKKMLVLGMIPAVQEPQTDAKGRAEERCRARSGWLDGSIGERFGGDWQGNIRMGASCDGASLAVRSQLEAAKLSPGKPKGSRYSGKNALALRSWNPRPDAPDDERWGGTWGKPCGHNEVSRRSQRRPIKGNPYAAHARLPIIGSIYASGNELAVFRSVPIAC